MPLLMVCLRNSSGWPSAAINSASLLKSNLNEWQTSQYAVAGWKSMDLRFLAPYDVIPQTLEPLSPKSSSLVGKPGTNVAILCTVSGVSDSAHVLECWLP